MSAGISTLWLAVILLSAVVLAGVVVVIAMESSMWFGFGHMGGFSDWMHGDYFENGTWRYSNNTDGWQCH